MWDAAQAIETSRWRRSISRLEHRPVLRSGRSRAFLGPTWNLSGRPMGSSSPISHGGVTTASTPTRASWPFDPSTRVKPGNCSRTSVTSTSMSWAPDSRALVTGGGDLKGRLGIFRIDAQTGDVALIVPIPQGAANSYPQWSPYGKHIYYRRPLTDDVKSSDVAFVERNLASGQEREVTRGDLGLISLSPDWGSIVAQKVDSTAKSSAVVLIPVEGGETRELLPPSQNQGILRFSGIPWTPDGRGVIVRKILSGGIREVNE